MDDIIVEITVANSILESTSGLVHNTIDLLRSPLVMILEYTSSSPPLLLLNFHPYK